MTAARSRRPGGTLAVAFILAGHCIGMSAPCTAAEKPPTVTLVAASVDRLQQRIDELLDLCGQPELADVLAQRLEEADDWPGIDRTRPLAFYRWNAASPDEGGDVLAIPATDPERLLETITWNVVPFQRTADDVFTIERPDIPVFALWSQPYVWIGDSLPQLRELARVEQPRLSAEERHPDIRWQWDPTSLSPTEREAAAETWRRTLAPWLQQRDDETDEIYQQRRRWGEVIVLVGELLLRDVTGVSGQIRLDHPQAEMTVNVDVEFRPGSPAARKLQLWKRTPHHLWSWTTRADARSQGVVQIPASVLDANLDSTAGVVTLAWQVFGDWLPVRTAVLVVDRPTDPKTAARSRDPERELVFESVRLPRLPNWVRTWIGGNTEALRLVEDSETWWGFGSPLLAKSRLDAALRQTTGDTADDPRDRSVAEFTIPLKEVWDWLPTIDPLWGNAQIARYDDRIRVSVTPEPTRLRTRLVLPRGVVRFIGGYFADELSADLERFLFAP